MRTETFYASILLALGALLAFQLPGSPVAAPALGVFIVLFLGTLATGKETASKLRYIYVFFLGLIGAAANKGSFEHVTLAVVISIHFLTWTEGFIATRRYAIKNGEPLPPDGRRGVYSLAFCAAIALSYLYLDGNEIALPAAARGFLAFIGVACGFALWDIGYVTRLQRATRFRRRRMPSFLRVMQLLVIAALLVSLFLVFGRAIPSTAHAIHDAAYGLKKGAQGMGGSPLQADRDRAPETDGWKLADDQHIQPHTLPAEGDFRPSPQLLLAMEVFDPNQRASLLQSRVYLRGYAFYDFSNDEWMAADATTGKILIDAHDGTKDGRVVVAHQDAPVTTAPAIVHDILLLEPFQRVLPALQSVQAYHLPMLHRKPGDWYVNVDPLSGSYTAESSPSLFSDIKNQAIATGDAPLEAFAVPDTPLLQDMRSLVTDLRGQPIEQRINSIVTLLDKRCDYSTSFDNPDQFTALQNFLYGEKQGMCIHYATAAALLFRLVDIPSRVAFGFSDGEYYEDEDVFAFRGRDAHVWVEVLLENHGWTVVDPTPGESGAARTPEISDAPQDYLDKINGNPIADESRNSGRSVAHWLRRLRTLPWGTMTIVMLGIIFLFAFLISWRQRKHEAAADGSVSHYSDSVQQQPRYLREFFKMCSRNFGVQKSTSETLAEFIGQLKKGGAIGDDFDALRDYHYAINYCESDPDKQREEELRQTVKTFAPNRGKN
ncbi:MAG: hypothetical protein ACI9R3_003969 [Verrucomicrobiales bacterium]|jgi:hypothetical protein